jgi:pimeloyl-ACP methyl ester carboxylesterase
MLRVCYSTLMRFYRDDPRTVLVHWYFCEPGAQALPVSTVFSSHQWDEEHAGYSQETLGEVWGAPRTIRDGSRIGNALGVNYCGSPDQWLRGQPLPPVPEIAVNAWDTPLCCDRPRVLISPNDFDFNQCCTLLWLMTLIRCTYTNDAALVRRCFLAVLAPGTTTYSLPNTSVFFPGFGLGLLPWGAVVAISGTTNLQQWEDQIFLSPLVNTNFPIVGGGVDNSQVLQCYVDAANDLDGKLSHLVDEQQPLLLCGHSMGGVVAQVLAFKLFLAGRRLGTRVCTFGQPKPGDALFLARGPWNGPDYFRLSTLFDPAPQVPPFVPALPYPLPAPLAAFAARYSAHVPTGPLHTIDQTGTIVVGVQPDLSAFVLFMLLSAAVGAPVPVFSAHDSGTYTTYLQMCCKVFPSWMKTGWNDAEDINRILAILNRTFYVQADAGAGASGPISAGPGIESNASSAGSAQIAAGQGIESNASSASSAEVLAGVGVQAEGSSASSADVVAGQGIESNASSASSAEVLAGVGVQAEGSSASSADVVAGQGIESNASSASSAEVLAGVGVPAEGSSASSGPIDAGAGLLGEGSAASSE